MKSFADDIINGLKGFAMGAANVIPGVSGGTIALITGIFGRLIEALNSILSFKTWKLLLSGRFREFSARIDLRFLMAVLIGIIISVFTLAKLMSYVLVSYPVQTWAFFFGMIAASAVFMLLMLKGWKVSYAIWLIIGVGLGLLVCTLSPTSTTDDIWFIAVCGAIAACTMILPGVSGSFVLLILGKYDYIMSSISELNWPVLVVFLVGCAVGIVAFSKTLHWLLGHFEQQTMLVLTGFILGSLLKVWPWSEESLSSAEAAAGGPVGTMILPGLLWMGIGIISVICLEGFSAKREGQNGDTGRIQ